MNSKSNGGFYFIPSIIDNKKKKKIKKITKQLDLGRIFS